MISFAQLLKYICFCLRLKKQASEDLATTRKRSSREVLCIYGLMVKDLDRCQVVSELNKLRKQTANSGIYGETLHFVGGFCLRSSPQVKKLIYLDMKIPTAFEK